MLGMKGGSHPGHQEAGGMQVVTEGPAQLAPPTGGHQRSFGWRLSPCSPSTSVVCVTLSLEHSHKEAE